MWAAPPPLSFPFRPSARNVCLLSSVVCRQQLFLSSSAMLGRMMSRMGDFNLAAAYKERPFRVSIVPSTCRLSPTRLRTPGERYCYAPLGSNVRTSPSLQIHFILDVSIEILRAHGYIPNWSQFPFGPTNGIRIDKSAIKMCHSDPVALWRRSLCLSHRSSTYSIFFLLCCIRVLFTFIHVRNLYTWLHCLNEILSVLTYVRAQHSNWNVYKMDE